MARMRVPTKPTHRPSKPYAPGKRTRPRAIKLTLSKTLKRTRPCTRSLSTRTTVPAPAVRTPRNAARPTPLLAQGVQNMPKRPPLERGPPTRSVARRRPPCDPKPLIAIPLPLADKALLPTKSCRGGGLARQRVPAPPSGPSVRLTTPKRHAGTLARTGLPAQPVAVTGKPLRVPCLGLSAPRKKGQTIWALHRTSVSK